MSTLRKITVDVYATWGDHAPRYRLYLDKELFTERDFVWPGHSIFIRENIEAYLQPGKHRIWIENLVPDSIVELKNLCVDGLEYASQSLKDEFMVHE